MGGPGGLWLKIEIKEIKSVTGFGYATLLALCSSLTFEVNSGKKYPIHPLDLSIISNPLTVDNHSVVACVSAFRGTSRFSASDLQYSIQRAFESQTGLH
jgi:hypothetical protein